MSDEEQHLDNSSDGELLTAKFKDGKLEIVEVASYSNSEEIEVPEVNADGEDLKYMQVLDPKSSVMDLLNFTLVRSDDGEQSYRLVSSSDDHGDEDATVTCVITGGDEDGEDQESQEYVMVEGVESASDGSLVLLQSASEPKMINAVVKKTELRASVKTPTSPSEILERAKALQKAKILMRSQDTVPRPRIIPAKSTRGSKRRASELPPPHELLASPSFKLFLYSCKMCRFKCNAIKELTAHKALEHASGAGSARWRGAGRAAAGSLQCARCPFRAPGHNQLMKHVQENHVENIPAKVYLDSAEVEAADVLVCGACGYESASRSLFRKHIEQEHGAAAC